MVSEEELKDGDLEDDEEIMHEADDEDQVAKTEPKFASWLSNLMAQTNCMRILLKLADYLDTSKVGGSDEDSEDEEFEDCEDMDEGEEEAAQVIDLDEQK